MTETRSSTLRLILWPSVITLVINIVRAVGQHEGWFTKASGGGGALVGITWLPLVFGPWFAWRLRKGGSTPRVARPWTWSLLAVLPLVIGGALTVPALLDANADEAGYATLRTAALAAIAGAVIGAIRQFVVWPRLAWILLVYAIPARLTVVALTWFAKSNGWDSHYTKFGPKGWEFDMEGTMSRAALMQLGFWVPVAVLSGTLLGTALFGRAKKA